jgi:hypothetical protein
LTVKILAEVLSASSEALFGSSMGAVGPCWCLLCVLLTKLAFLPVWGAGELKLFKHYGSQFSIPQKRFMLALPALSEQMDFLFNTLH